LRREARPRPGPNADEVTIGDPRVAYTGTSAPSTAGATFTKGTAGAGGKGDDSMANTGDGAPGVAAEVQQFP
jgi:hypothetical protein